MKVCIISTAAIPSPPPDGQYSGVEAVSFNLAEGLTKLGNQVTLITTNESPKIGMFQAKNPNGDIVGSLEVRGAGETSWNPGGERTMFQNYVGWLEKEFSDGQGVVIDYSWGGWPYVLAAGKLGLKPHPNMKIIHTCHAMSNWFNPLQQKFSPPPVPFPRLIGVSSGQAAYLSSSYGIPVRYIHNGMNLPPKPEKVESDGFLLSLNRIAVEKNITGCIDVALRTNHMIKVVGPDNWVPPEYVATVVDRCHFSGGQAQYYGHVDMNTKNELLQRCKAVILCPDPTRYVEAFGLAAVEANAYCKPVIAIRNGGLVDIVQNGVNGILCNSIDEIVDSIKSGALDRINPDNCRIASERFTTEIMCNRYHEMIDGVMRDDQSFRW